MRDYIVIKLSYCYETNTDMPHLTDITDTPIYFVDT
jgi:hypothetical protein